MSLPVVDTRALFRPLTQEIVALERRLSPADWERPTLAARWRVRDVAAHMLDTALRRLSLQRDRHQPPPARIESSDDLLALINTLNADWVEASARLSPRVITDLYAFVSSELSEFFEKLPIDAPALFPVSWAGDAPEGWLDTGREFTEVWHHGAQIRDAVGAGPFSDPAWLRAVLQISMWALPHAYRDVPASSGQTLAIVVTGPAGGHWLLRRGDARWQIEEGESATPDARATMPDESAWRLLFNALSRSGAEPPQIEGDLARPLLRARSVIV
jgi:uncharacterized protein (TIGR03083 family)